MEHLLCTRNFYSPWQPFEVSNRDKPHFAGEKNIFSRVGLQFRSQHDCYRSNSKVRLFPSCSTALGEQLSLHTWRDGGQQEGTV